MININNRDECMGCTACAQSCINECIMMEQDEEGFLYPVVDNTRCLKCNRCQQVCPALNTEGGRIPKKVLAEKNRNSSIRKTSSSGGVFTELASAIIAEEGVVYGCAFDDRMVASHIRVDDLQDIERLRGSKYVQSDLSNIMSMVKADLTHGRKVLFSGTPCQVAGLRRFLNKAYDNLVIVDVLCHGVPSPSLFKDYLAYISRQYGGGKPVSVDFRNKKRGWKRLYTEIKFGNGKRHYIYAGYDRYESMFLSNISLRPSCYSCKYASSKRFGDITLGDFWGLGKKYPDWDDDKGISLVMLNTKKGEYLWSIIESRFDGREETLETAMAGQRTLYAPTEKHQDRDCFYEKYASEGIENALKAYTHVPNIFVRGFYTTMRRGFDIVRKLMKRGY